jgi:predicted metal-dependent phosphoesterase TrpH
MCNIPGLDRICRESYNDPVAVYESLKRRGMELVTVTDHDSIDAVEQLRRYPDFFLSEEVTCVTPSGTEIHVGVYGIEERHHIELARRRRDVPSLAAYLREQNIFFSINHVFSSLTGRRTGRDFHLFQNEFPAIETRNGQIPEKNNRSADQLARDWRKATVAGSDAHTLASLGLTYTEVSGARSVRDFLRGLRHGHARVHGVSGNYGKLTRAVIEIGLRLVQEYPWMIPLAPLLAAIPLVTLGNYVREIMFEYKWARRVCGSSESNGFRIPVADPLFEVTDIGK